MSYRNVLVIGFSLILATLLLQCQEIHGKEFLVGDKKGWRHYPGLSDWPNGKNFTPGDILVFKFDNATAQLLRLEYTRPGYSKNCYDKCDIVTCPFTRHDTGYQRFGLRDGENYYLSSNYEYCMQGFRLKLCAQYDSERGTKKCNEYI